VRKVLRAISTPLTLLILLGILGYGAWWGYKTVTAEVPPPPATPCVTMGIEDLTPASVTVNVYNGGDLRGLASSIGKALREGGFIVGTVGNTDTRVRATVIVGASRYSPEVTLVASWFVDPEIMEDGRIDHTVDVLVGNEYDQGSGMVENPPTSVPVTSGNVCLPETPTPTPTPEPSDEPS
jgi:hypothetical protein